MQDRYARCQACGDLIDFWNQPAISFDFGKWFHGSSFIEARKQCVCWWQPPFHIWRVGHGWQLVPVTEDFEI